MIYEFITPSDAITFVASSDAVAYAVALYTGRGKAVCNRADGKSLGTCLIFASEAYISNCIRDNLGTATVNEFIEAHLDDCIAAFDSFAYANLDKRAAYDAAVANIQDPAALHTFRTAHENTRTSMSAWVAYAWDTAEHLRKMAAGATCPTEVAT